MRRLLEFKTLIIIFALAGLAGMGLLAVALREVEFQPAGPLPFSFGRGADPAGGLMPLDLSFFKLMVFVFVIVLLGATILIMFNPKLRKRLLLTLLRMVLTMAGLYWLMKYSNLHVFSALPQNAAGGGAPAGGPDFTQATPVFEQPPVNPWFVFAISLLVALGLVALAWLVATRSSRARHSMPFGDLADIARRALDDLQDGRNWDDAIIQAYIRMNEVVTAERGMIRQPGVTPFEFAVRMEQMGLPGEAARTLTRLFERVRYGGQASTRQERDLAAAALNAIVRACGNSHAVQTGQESA